MIKPKNGFLWNVPLQMYFLSLSQDATFIFMVLENFTSLPYSKTLAWDNVGMLLVKIFFLNKIYYMLIL